MTEIVRDLAYVAGSRLLRCRTVFANLVLGVVDMYKENSVIREELYTIITALTPKLGSGFVKAIQKDVLTLACRDFTFQKPVEQLISQVEQQSVSKKSKKRKSSSAVVFKGEIKVGRSLALAALNMVSAIVKKSLHVLPEKMQMTIHQCLSYNYTLFYTTHSSSFNQKYDSEVMEKCGSVLVEIIRNSRYNQSEMIPLAMKMSKMSDNQDLATEIRNIIHPSVPALPRNIHKRQMLEVEEEDEEEEDVVMAENVVETFEVSVQTLVDEKPRMNSSSVQTEEWKEKLDIAAPSVPPSIVKASPEPVVTSMPKKPENIVKPPSTPAPESETKDKEEVEVSDWEDFEIVDSKPDE